jgi:hypothetical protein
VSLLSILIKATLVRMAPRWLSATGGRRRAATKVSS